MKFQDEWELTKKVNCFHTREVWWPKMVGHRFKSTDSEGRCTFYSTLSSVEGVSWEFLGLLFFMGAKHKVTKRITRELQTYINRCFRDSIPGLSSPLVSCCSDYAVLTHEPSVPHSDTTEDIHCVSILCMCKHFCVTHSCTVQQPT
jgi:hypothetical protein